MKKALTIAHTVWLELLRRKDIYVVLILLAFLTLMLGTIDSFGTELPSTYILDVGLLFTLLFSCILSVTLTVRQIPEEEQTGTLFSILTKPISRSAFLMGKWIGTFSSLIVANLLFYLAVIAATALHGFEFSILALIQTCYLHCTLLGIIAAIALFFSTFLSKGAANALSFTTTALCFVYLQKIPQFLIQESGWREKCMWFIYFAAPHLELFDMRRRLIHDWGPLDPMIFLGTVAYGLLVTALFIGLAWCVFRNRRFKRDRFA